MLPYVTGNISSIDEIDEIDEIHAHIGSERVHRILIHIQFDWLYKS